MHVLLSIRKSVNVSTLFHRPRFFKYSTYESHTIIIISQFSKKKRKKEKEKRKIRRKKRGKEFHLICARF